MQLEKRTYKYDISFVLPSMNEGESVSKLLDELIAELESTGLKWEIIAIDSPSENLSYPTLKKYAKKYPQITAILLTQKRKAGSGKTFQYMLGFDLAEGRLIGQIDSDGQDNPADLPKYLGKIKEGYDLVVGYKQDRKDGAIYVLSSKIGNALNRVLAGVEVHDMNCGFKVYRAEAAKSLNLKSRWYRFIPSILNSQGFKITEVPIENRRREYGATNFSFVNRLQSLFDLLVVSILNRFSDVPIYFWGWLSILSIGLSGLVLTISFLFTDLMVFSKSGAYVAALLSIGAIAFMIGIMIEFRRNEEPFRWTQNDIKEFYRTEDLID